MSGIQPTVTLNSEAKDDLSQSSIKGDAKECRELFADLLSLPSDAIFSLATKLQDEYGRFNLWAATMAIFAPDQACLDFRLKDVPEARDLFIEQLGVLATRLEQCRHRFWLSVYVIVMVTENLPQCTSSWIPITSR
jgi:hypothetical protein